MSTDTAQEIMPIEPSKEQLDIIFYHGAYPVWKYLIQKFSIDIREVCDRVAREEPVLNIHGKKLVLRTVQPGYKYELDESYNGDITFLLNCANVVFNTLKEGIIKHGNHILKPYVFQLDENNNMELKFDEDPAVDRSCAVQSFNDVIKLAVVDITNERTEQLTEQLHKRARTSL